MSETPNTHFEMRGAREAMAKGLTHVEEQVKGIERAIVENPGLAFDLAKALIESTCRAVLKERSILYAANDDLPKLFRSASQNLPFLPYAASDAAEVRKSLQQTLAGLSTAVQGICELRNQCTFASHGFESARPVMEDVQARLAAEAADTIVGFLYRVHRQDQDRPTAATTIYEDNPAFNESLDEAFGPFRIHEVEFRPSEVLFSLEPETYRIYLAEFDGDSDANASSDGTTEP